MPKMDIPLETLIQQLHGSDWTARCDAARLLGQSGDPRAEDALLPDLSDPDWRVRRNAAQALGALRDKRAVEPLLTILQDRTMTVRQRAIVALGRIKDIQALPALLDILLQNKHESYDASKAIRKFGKKALPEMVKTFQRSNHQGLLLLLVDMKYEGAFDLIVKYLESDKPSARITAIRELGKLRDERGIPQLINQLKHNDLTIQGDAVRALGILGATEAIPTMLDLLKDGELFGPRSSVYHAVTEAFQIFGGVGDEIKNAFPGSYPAIFSSGGAPISLPEAMGRLGNDPSNILSNALSRLQTGVIKPDNLNGPAADAVHKAIDDMAWKFGVMFADARDAQHERVIRLIELLKSESKLKRCAAALTLPWYGDERSLEPLKQLLLEEDEMTHNAATWAVNALQKAVSYRKQSGM